MASEVMSVAFVALPVRRASRSSRSLMKVSLASTLSRNVSDRISRTPR